MKIYIVTAGEYSDYHICKVFTDKEKAEKYVALQNELNPHDEGWLTEWETADDKVDANVKVAHYYFCSISLDDGVIFDDYGTDETYPMIDKGDVIIQSDEYDISVYSKKSFEHAKKICIEQYQIKTQQKLENGEI